MAAQVFTNLGETQINHNLFMMKVYCKCDTTKTTWDSTYILKRIQGEIICVDTVPGATAPTLNYDLYLRNAQSIDIMGGALENRSNTANERAWPWAVVGQTTYIVETPVDQELQIVMSGNSVSGADWYMYIYYQKPVDEGLG